MTTLEVQKETKVNGNGNLSFYCYVTLKDSEQIIIDIEEQAWRGGSYQKTGVIKKVRLEQLSYQSKNDNDIVTLHALEVRGFRKDKGLRYRTEMVYHLDQKVIDQIPDEYHNYAKEKFAKEVSELQNRLTTMTNGGIQIGNKQYIPIKL
jgi:hypothetical protein